MRHLTVQERMLIFAVLAILLVGACVDRCRKVSVSPPPPELGTTVDPTPLTVPSLNDLEEAD